MQAICLLVSSKSERELNFIKKKYILPETMHSHSKGLLDCYRSQCRFEAFNRNGL